MIVWGIISLRSGLNFVDLMVRQGNIDNPPKTPLVPGFECSGIVEAMGDNTTGFEVGESASDDSLLSLTLSGKLQQAFLWTAVLKARFRGETLRGHHFLPFFFFSFPFVFFWGIILYNAYLIQNK